MSEAGRPVPTDPPPPAEGPSPAEGGVPAAVARPGVGRPDRPAVGWTEIVVAAVVYVALQLLLGLVAFVATGGRTPASPWLVGLSAVSAYGAVAVAVLVRVRSAAALGLRRVRPVAVLAGVGAGVAVWLLSRVLVIVYVLLTHDRSDPQADLTVFGGPVSTVLVVVGGGLVVPLGEELLFRGIGYGGLRRYGVVVPAIVTALVFGLAHGLNVVLAAAALLGLGNALIYERTRSIWPAAAAHATFNLLSFGLALALR